MALYRPRGSKRYVFDFVFRGQRIRESTGMTSITRAKKVYDNRRRELEDGTAGIRRKKNPGLLSTAAEEWRELRKGSWAPNTLSIVGYAFDHLLPVLGKRLLVDIEARDIARYQAQRLEEGASARTVNIEVGFLRQIMRKHGTWARIAPDVRMLAERQDVGRALTAQEESMLLLECGRSTSRILLPFVVLSLETGARFNTVRTLRWCDVDFGSRSLKLGKDKTVAGSGRSVPLSRRAVDVLQIWAQQFPDRQPDHAVFPSEKYGLHGKEGTFGGEVKVYSCDPKNPVGCINSAWHSAKARTRRHCPNCKTGILADQQKPAMGFRCVDCRLEASELPLGLTGLRLHDLRHSAVSRMISARIPLPIIGKIVGWSPSTLARMSARYGHFGLDEMRGAVEAISRQPEAILEGSPQFSPQSPSDGGSRVN